MNYRFIRHVVARLLQIEAAFLLLPLLVALYYREPMANVQAFLQAITLILLFSIILGHQGVGEGKIYDREGVVIVSLSWILLSVFGSLPFYISGQIPRFIDALFETVSGFTTTGSTILTDVEVLSRSMHFWRSFTHFVGGMGILVFALAILPQMGGSLRILRAEVPGPEFGRIISRVSVTARFLYKTYLGMSAVLTVLLMFGGMDLFDALVHSFSIASTGGFSPYNASIGHFNSAYIETLSSVAMVLFGINFTLFYLSLTGHLKNALEDEELRWYAVILFGSALLMSLNVLPIYENFFVSLRHAFFVAGSIMTTGGLMTVDYSSWPLFSHIIILTLMFIGASSGSTAGGLKVSRLRYIVKGAILEIFHVREPKRIFAIRHGTRAVEPEILKSVFNYFGLIILLIGGMTFLISAEHPDMLSAFSAVLASFNNIGPGLGDFGPAENYAAISDWSKGMLSAAMLLGRLEIFPILILFTPSTWKKTL